MMLGSKVGRETCLGAYRDVRDKLQRRIEQYFTLDLHPVL